MKNQKHEVALTSDGSIAIIDGILYRREQPAETPNADKMIKKLGKAKRKVERMQRAPKSMHWKNHAKIKRLHAAGKSSSEVADELGLPLEEVNKHWPATSTDEL